MTLNTMSRRAWRNELQFPYHNLKDIETALIRQRRRLTHLSRLVDELVQEWRGLYPRGRSQKALMPFYRAACNSAPITCRAGAPATPTNPCSKDAPT